MNAARRSRLGVALSLLMAAAFVGPAAAHAEFPGANGRIAFWNFYNGQIYTANPDGSALVQLTHVGKGRAAGLPDWSPNGRRLVFTKFLPDGGARIWTMRADGSHQRRIAGDAEGVQDFLASYTPDARHIVFSRCRPDGDSCAILKMRTDGANRHALTRYREHEQDVHLSVSPEGKIAFTQYGSGGRVVRVFVMRADGSNPHPVTAAWREAGDPEWSPSGRRIVFNSHFTHCCRTDLTLFTMKPDGSDVQRITPHRFPHGDFQPAYSPEGDRIVFVSDRNYPDYCCNDLFTIDPDGSNEQMLHNLDSLDGVLDPDWGTAPLIP